MAEPSADCRARLQTHGAELVDMLMERAAIGTPAGRSHLRTLLTLVVERAERAESAFVQLAEVMCAGWAAAPSAAPAKPLSSVRGLVAAGAMCRHVIVGGTHCGYGGECVHKRIEAPAAELNHLEGVSAGPPLVPQAVIESIQAYGDARADGAPSGPTLVACVTAIREALAGSQPDAAAAAPASVLSPSEAEAERTGFEADAIPYGFDLTRQKTLAPEPWSEYRDEGTRHRWAGWLARASRNGRGAATVETQQQSLA